MPGMIDPRMAQMGLLGAQMMQNKDRGIGGALGGVLSSPQFMQSLMMPGQAGQGQMPIDQGGQPMPQSNMPVIQPSGPQGNMPVMSPQQQTAPMPNPGFTDKDLMATGQPMQPMNSPDVERMRQMYLQEMARLQGTGVR